MILEMSKEGPDPGAGAQQGRPRGDTWHAALWGPPTPARTYPSP